MNANFEDFFLDDDLFYVSKKEYTHNGVNFRYVIELESDYSDTSVASNLNTASYNIYVVPSPKNYSKPTIDDLCETCGFHKEEMDIILDTMDIFAWIVSNMGDFLLYIPIKRSEIYVPVKDDADNIVNAIFVESNDFIANQLNNEMENISIYDDLAKQVLDDISLCF